MYKAVPTERYLSWSVLADKLNGIEVACERSAQGPQQKYHPPN
jgi:hypothetical protein